MKKFEAVSGDQSLFDLVGASDDEMHIIKRGRCVLSVCYVTLADEIIAERKPIEKYVPKVGEEFKPDGAALEYKCVFIDKHGVVYGENNGELNWWNDRYDFTKIDRSPNPVNMVEVILPKVGEWFKIDEEMDRTFKCSKISGGYVVTECGSSFSIGCNKFYLTSEEKWIPKEGESFKVGVVVYHNALVFSDGEISGEYGDIRKIHKKNAKFERP